MNYLNSRGGVLAFTLAYIALSAVYLFAVGNVEFTRYLLLLIAAVTAFTVLRDHLPLPAWLLWLVSFVGLSHLLGGMVRIDGDVLYAFVPVVIANPFDLTILKYDQIVHMYSSGVGALVVFAYLRAALSGM